MIQRDEIARGTKIKNIRTNEEYIFDVDNFKNTQKGNTRFLRRCNLNETFEFIEKNKLKLYDLVKWNGYEWYVINLDNNQITLFMKDKFTPKMCEKYFDKRLLDSDKDVKFNPNYKNIWWADSPIRMTLNSKFLEDLKIDEMKLMETTVSIDKKNSTTEDYVRLITKEEVEKLPMEIRMCSGNYGYWTMSPSLFNSAFIANEFIVHSTGELYDWYHVSSWYGVRPVISLKANVDNLIKIESQCINKQI